MHELDPQELRGEFFTFRDAIECGETRHRLRDSGHVIPGPQGRRVPRVVRRG